MHVAYIERNVIRIRYDSKVIANRLGLDLRLTDLIKWKRTSFGIRKCTQSESEASPIQCLHQHELSS